MSLPWNHLASPAEWDPQSREDIPICQHKMLTWPPCATHCFFLWNSAKSKWFGLCFHWSNLSSSSPVQVLQSTMCFRELMRLSCHLNTSSCSWGGLEVRGVVFGCSAHKEPWLFGGDRLDAGLAVMEGACRAQLLRVHDLQHCLP